MSLPANIYIPAPLERYELCQPVDQDDFETIITQVDGTSRTSTWQPIKAVIIHGDRGRKFLESDAPWLGSHALVFRQGTVGNIGSLLTEFGEVLPPACPEAALSLFHCTRVIDAL